MVPLLVLGVALLVGGTMLARWYVQAEPKQLVRFVRWLALGLGVLFVVFIFVSGRWGWLPGVAIIALPWISRLRALSAIAKNVRGPSPGQTTEVETEFLRMSLNHDTNEIDGEVLVGTHRGRRLGAMSVGDLLDLWQESASDEQSRAVLESYLDRVHGAAWRERASERPTSGTRATGAPMSQEEACEVLGVAAQATDEEIEQAYRRLMLKMHPDHGGSDYLAAKINQAKEVLLAR